MTKADIVADISDKTGIEKVAVQSTVEAFMNVIKGSLENGENVYLRGFGSFIVKKRAEKTGRNISKNTTIIIPAHHIPAFKAAKTFVERVKTKVSGCNSLAAGVHWLLPWPTRSGPVYGVSAAKRCGNMGQTSSS